MDQQQIIAHLEARGFIQQPKLGWSNRKGHRPRRFVHPRVQKRGSLYATPDYLSATGHYKTLADEVAPTGWERKAVPFWQDEHLSDMLRVISAAYR